MKTGTKLIIEMEVKDDGIQARVRLDGDEKTYFFSFTTPYNETSHIDLWISPLPKRLYVDAFLEKIKGK